MIRFWLPETERMDLDQYDKCKMGRYLSEPHNKDKVILLYKKDNLYHGFVTAESLGQKDEIVQDKYVIGRDQNLWQELRDILEHNEQNLIPVFDQKDRLWCFALSDSRSEIEQLDYFGLVQLEEGAESVFLKEIYPQVKKVYLYGFNEFAYRFYRILRARNIDVAVSGKLWEVFCPDILHECQQDDDIPYVNRMNIYADGRRFIQEQNFRMEEGIIQAWKFLYRIALANRGWMERKLHDVLKARNILVLSSLFPNFSELQSYTLEEYWRNREGCDPVIKKDGWKGKIESEQMKAVGGWNSYQEYCERVNKNYGVSRRVGDWDVASKKYGQGISTLYLIGPCIVSNALCEETSGLENCILQELLKLDSSWQIVCLIICTYKYSDLDKLISSLTLREGDIILFLNNGGLYDKETMDYPNDIDLKAIIDRRTTNWFWNVPIHTNQEGNRQIAKAIVNEYLREYIIKPTDKKIIQLGQCCLGREAEAAVNRYISEIKSKNAERSGMLTGAVVMNCNPMTKGHLHLVEEALKQVDFLYVFVVEENKSEFPFWQRFQIVSNVLAHKDNVSVVPSGKFILSSETLPIYFEKAVKQEERVNATEDMMIFCEKVAPGLHISIRFVGEEPIDQVTRQYNEFMKEIFPYYGLQIVESPRLLEGEHIISASRVRRYMKEGNWAMVEELVPKEAFEILQSDLEGRKMYGAPD